MEAQEFFNATVAAAAQIGTSGRWDALNDAITRHAANPGKDNGWYLQVLAGIAGRAFADYLALKREYETHPQRDPALLAWRARNLLEVSVWAMYVTSARQNAWRFYEDAGRDARDVIKVFQTWGAGNEDAEWMRELAEAQRELEDRAAGEGIESLDGGYKAVQSAAAECQISDHFRVHYKVLSKFAHPTAMQMVANPDQGRNSLQRLLFLSNGSLFFSSAFEALEKILLRTHLAEQ